MRLAKCLSVVSVIAANQNGTGGVLCGGICWTSAQWVLLSEIVCLYLFSCIFRLEYLTLLLLLVQTFFFKL